MDMLMHLWIPILASAAAVWFASALGWMLIGHHNKDSTGVPNEKEFLQVVKSMNIPAGAYMFPFFGSHKEANTPENRVKWREGPAGMLRVWGPTNMGLNMAKTLVIYVLVSVLLAYVGSAALPAGASFGKVMQVLGTAGVLAYTAASLPNDIWFQKPGRAVVMHVIDGIVFGLITGAIFAWLWPRA